MAHAKTPGDLLRAARKRSNKTQEQIAAEMGISQPGVARWESGRSMPRDIRRAARAYGIAARRLIDAFVAERRKAAA